MLADAASITIKKWFVDGQQRFPFVQCGVGHSFIYVRYVILVLYNCQRHFPMVAHSLFSYNKTLFLLSLPGVADCVETGMVDAA